METDQSALSSIYLFKKKIYFRSLKTSNQDMLLQKLSGNEKNKDTKNEIVEDTESQDISALDSENYATEPSNDNQKIDTDQEKVEKQEEKTVIIKPKRVQTEKQKLAFIKCMERRKAQVEKIKNLKEEEKVKERIERKARKLKQVLVSDEMKQVILQIYKSERESEKAAKVKKPSLDELVNSEDFENKIKQLVIQVKEEKKLKKQQEKNAKAISDTPVKEKEIQNPEGFEISRVEPAMEVKPEEIKNPKDFAISGATRKPAVELPRVVKVNENPFAGFNFL